MGIVGVLTIVVNWCVIIMWCCSYCIQARPYNEVTRACGDHLADVLALVCKDRGYNVYFSSDAETNERRHKRGIVEECCHHGCSYHTLEQYCKPISTEMPDNSQIRKRSDNDKSWEVRPNDKSLLTKNLYFRHRSYENNEQVINFGNKKGLFSRLIGGRNIDNKEENVRNKNDQEINSLNRRLDNQLDNGTSPTSKELSRRSDNRTQQDEQPKQDHNNRSSRVGYVDPYFMNKELVHPHVKPSVDFTVNNLRQPVQ